ncbi:MAG: hypothetical protein IEMM0003_0866 [bacterium]|nr:MAG: hypothetical protein IEMM0003_0866 [bacterium]
MANICDNYVVVKGSLSVLRQVDKILNESEEFYCINEVIKTTLSEIGKASKRKWSYSIDSKWSPPSDFLMALSRDYNVIITNTYQEFGMSFEGIETYYQGRKIDDVCVHDVTDPSYYISMIKVETIDGLLERLDNDIDNNGAGKQFDKSGCKNAEEFVLKFGWKKLFNIAYLKKQDAA